MPVKFSFEIPEDSNSKFDQIIQKLDQLAEASLKIIELAKEIQGKEVDMSAQLDALTAAVAENTSLDDSAIQLINGLAAQIESLKTDPAALQALADTLKAKSQALKDAILANTPTPPAP